MMKMVGSLASRLMPATMPALIHVALRSALSMSAVPAGSAWISAMVGVKLEWIANTTAPTARPLITLYSGLSAMVASPYLVVRTVIVEECADSLPAWLTAVTDTL